jgi:hypothetical protein
VKKNEQWIYLLVISSGLAAMSCFFFLGSIRLGSGLILGVSTLVSLFYVLRIKGRNLREVPFIKIHLIAISWSLILIIFPMLNEGIANGIIWNGIAFYFYVLGVTIPFDIRDLKYDLPNQMTIPQLTGVIGAKIIALFTIVLFSLMVLYIDQRLWWNPVFYAAILVQIALVIFMNERRSDLYCAGWIDGAIALLGFSYFF